MAITASVELYDRISSPVETIYNNLNHLIGGFENLKSASSDCLGNESYKNVANDVGHISDETDEATRQQQEYNNTVNQGGNDVDGLAGKVGRLLGTYISLRAAFSVLETGIEYASDLSEVQNVVDVSFGESSEQINEWSKTALKAYGINEVTAKQYAGTMGAMLKSSGLAGDSITDMSTSIAGLAGDMASFYNLDTDEAFAKIRSGISGETEPLKQLGINMSVANLEAYALAQGIGKSYAKMTQGEQTMLRYKYLMQATADQQGDYARTFDSYANQSRYLGEAWKEFLGQALEDLLPMLSSMLGMLNGILAFMSENWDVIQPILLGLLAIIGVYLIQMYAVKVATMIWAAAQWVLNAALSLNPISLVIIAIIALIAAIYAVTAATNKATGNTISALGIIVGAVFVAIAAIYNTVIGIINGIIAALWAAADPILGLVEWVLNVFNGGFESFGGAVANLIGQIISWFLSLGKVVTQIIDSIFGTDWTAGLSSLQEDVIAWGKTDDAITIDRTTPQIERIAYGEAYNAGYDLGAEWGDKISDVVNDTNLSLGDTSAMDATAANTGAIADNTGDIAKALDITSQDLKYIRDFAEEKAVDRYLSTDIKIEMTNNNTINGEQDVHGIVDKLRTALEEEMIVSAEGVH